MKKRKPSDDDDNDDEQLQQLSQQVKKAKKDVSGASESSDEKNEKDDNIFEILSDEESNGEDEEDYADEVATAQRTIAFYGKLEMMNYKFRDEDVEDAYNEALDLLDDGISYAYESTLGGLLLTPLMAAIHGNHLGIVRHMVDSGVSVISCNSLGHSALTYAAYCCRNNETDDIYKLILDKSEIESKETGQPAVTTGGVTPLMILATVENWPMFQYTQSKYKHDINAVNGDGNNALVCVLGQQFSQLFPSTVPKESSRWRINRLVEWGININNKNKNGETALMIAAQNGLTEAVDSLIRYGADPFIVDGTRETPREIAKGLHYRTVVDVLEKAEKEWTPPSSWTPSSGRNEDSVEDEDEDDEDDDDEEDNE